MSKEPKGVEPKGESGPADGSLRFLSDAGPQRILGSPGEMRGPLSSKFRAVSADYLQERRRIEELHGSQHDGVPVVKRSH